MAGACMFTMCQTPCSALFIQCLTEPSWQPLKRMPPLAMVIAIVVAIMMPPLTPFKEKETEVQGNKCNFF